MTSNLITQCGAITGTRLTVYDLLPHFLDPTATEAYLCRLYEITPEQVAAARAHVFNNLDTVLAQHLKIEERIAEGNSPEVAQQAERTRAAMRSFKQWLTEQEELVPAKAGNLPSFREWFAERESHWQTKESSSIVPPTRGRLRRILRNYFLIWLWA